MKRLAQLKIRFFGDIPAPLPQPAFRVGVAQFLHLASVAAQRPDFKIEGGGDVGTIIDILGRPEQDLFYLMGPQPLREKIRIGEMIPGVGENRVQHDLAGDAMIAVPDIASIGVGGYDGVRAVLPYQPHDTLSEFRGFFKPLVR